MDTSLYRWLVVGLLALPRLAQAIDIDDVQSQVFTPSCAFSGCHAGSIAPDLRSGVAFSRTVNVPSNQQPALFYVNPGNPADSYLLRKLQGTGSGGIMPVGGGLPASSIQLVSDWISQGALEDDTPVPEPDPDADGDGKPDETDNCPQIANSDQLDTDADGSGDACDTDDDNDGVVDSGDAFPLDPGESLDTDSDGTGNNADTDDDNDGVPDADDVFPLDNREWSDADMDGVGDNADTDNATRGHVYLMTTSTSQNVTSLHIINSSSGPQAFTGTLYNESGTQLGSTNVPLHNGVIASQARLVLTSENLETLFNIEPWVGPAQLIVRATSAFDLMTKLTSPSGLVSNTNCVRTNRAHNVEGENSSNRTFIRLINTGDSTISNIRGTLKDASGTTIGAANIQLAPSLAPRQAMWLTREDIALLTGATWQDSATLTADTAHPDLRLLNLNLVNDETFFNFSCFESQKSARVFLMTNAASQNVSETHVINTSDSAATFTGTLYQENGVQLGSADATISGSVAPGGRVVLSAGDLEAATGAATWPGPAMVEVKGSETFELMIRLTSPSKLISNTNCVRENNVQNIEGVNSANRTFVRFINQGNNTISNIRGTLYDRAGSVLGSADTQLLTSLAPKAATWLDRDQLRSLFGATWNDEASLIVTADNSEDLRLLNLNLVNGETFFNFSCYETGRAETSTDAFGYFVDHVSANVIQDRCVTCHVSGGLAAATDLVYQPASAAGYQQSNFNLLNDYISADPSRANTILEKARGVNHGGGTQLSSDSADYQNLSTFLGLIGGEINSSGSLGDFWEGVVQASPAETLRRASLTLAGRLPTEAEVANAESSDDGLRVAVRDLMTGERFHEFLVNGANDRLFTDAFVSGDLFFEAADINARPFFPIGATMFYEDQPTSQQEQIQKFLWVTEWRWALARAPLELIAYIVENDRNYQEVVTADYVMLNPRTNTILNGGLSFDDEEDLSVYLPGQNNGQIVRDDAFSAVFEQQFGTQILSHGDYLDYPQAGVLNTHAFLSRYPTTETNRNRARSRWTYFHFLGHDVEKSAERTTDPEALADTDNPTLNNPACTACHATLDPVAGAFQNYGNEGFYRDKQGGNDSLPLTYKFPRFFDEDAEPSGYSPGDTWFADMREPGFETDVAPDAANSVQWLGQVIAADSRFGPVAVKFWWPAVMGSDPLAIPEASEDADFQDKLLAFEEQNSFIEALGNQFSVGINGGAPFNGKDLLTEMMLSPWFRSSQVDAAVGSPGAGATTANIGIRRLLTPSELENKTRELLGFAWGGQNEAPWEIDGYYTTLVDQFGIYYGGIDSNGIKKRARELTALMANVAEKQAVSTACPAVVIDFAEADGQRRLFNNLTRFTTPTSEFFETFQVRPDNFASASVYTVTGELSADTKSIFVSFLNDYFGDDGDRNLHVVRLRVFDATETLIHEVNFADIASTPGATAECGEAGSNDYNLFSNCSVNISFTPPMEGSYAIVVDAWAEQAGDATARMAIGVNDDDALDANAAGALAIKNKLIDLHDRFLGESVSLDDESLELAYLLLVETWQERMASPDNDWAWTAPNENCAFFEASQWQAGGVASQASDSAGMLYTWTTMLIYFMTDFNYLHE